MTKKRDELKQNPWCWLDDAATHEKQGFTFPQVKPSLVFYETPASLSRKIPVVPGPTDVVKLYTTKLGTKRFQVPPDAEFDMKNPSMPPNAYNFLHDPHLYEYLNHSIVKKRLYEEGLITKGGFVRCTIKEFNDYRQWIRKLKLDAIDQDWHLKKSNEGKSCKRTHFANDEALELTKQRQERAIILYRRKQEKKIKATQIYLKKKLEGRDMQIEGLDCSPYLSRKQRNENRRLKGRQGKELTGRKKRLKNLQSERLRQKGMKAKALWDRRQSYYLQKMEEERNAKKLEEEQRRRSIDQRDDFYQRERRKSEIYMLRRQKKNHDISLKHLEEANEFFDKIEEKKQKEIKKWRLKLKSVEQRERILEYYRQKNVYNEKKGKFRKRHDKNRNSVWDVDNVLLKYIMDELTDKERRELERFGVINPEIEDDTESDQSKEVPENKSSDFITFGDIHADETVNVYWQRRSVIQPENGIIVDIPGLAIEHTKSVHEHLPVVDSDYDEMKFDSHIDSHSSYEILVIPSRPSSMGIQVDSSIQSKVTLIHLIDQEPILVESADLATQEPILVESADLATQEPMLVEYADLATQTDRELIIETAQRLVHDSLEDVALQLEYGEDEILQQISPKKSLEDKLVSPVISESIIQYSKDIAELSLVAAAVSLGYERAEISEVLGISPEKICYKDEEENFGESMNALNDLYNDTVKDMVVTALTQAALQLGYSEYEANIAIQNAKNGEDNEEETFGESRNSLNDLYDDTVKGMDIKKSELSCLATELAKMAILNASTKLELESSLFVSSLIDDVDTRVSASIDAVTSNYSLKSLPSGIEDDCVILSHNALRNAAISLGYTEKEVDKIIGKEKHYSSEDHNQLEKERPVQRISSQNITDPSASMNVVTSNYSLKGLPSVIEDDCVILSHNALRNAAISLGYTEKEVDKIIGKEKHRSREDNNQHEKEHLVQRFSSQNITDSSASMNIVTSNYSLKGLSSCIESQCVILTHNALRNAAISLGYTEKEVDKIIGEEKHHISKDHNQREKEHFMQRFSSQNITDPSASMNIVTSNYSLKGCIGSQCVILTHNALRNAAISLGYTEKEVDKIIGEEKHHISEDHNQRDKEHFMQRFSSQNIIDPSASMNVATSNYNLKGLSSRIEDHCLILSHNALRNAAISLGYTEKEVDEIIGKEKHHISEDHNQREKEYLMQRFSSQNIIDPSVSMNVATSNYNLKGLSSRIEDHCLILSHNALRNAAISLGYTEKEVNEIIGEEKHLRSEDHNQREKEYLMQSFSCQNITDPSQTLRVEGNSYNECLINASSMVIADVIKSAIDIINEDDSNLKIIAQDFVETIIKSAVNIISNEQLEKDAANMQRELKIFALKFSMVVIGSAGKRLGYNDDSILKALTKDLNRPLGKRLERHPNVLVRFNKENIAKTLKEMLQIGGRRCSVEDRILTPMPSNLKLDDTESMGHIQTNISTEEATRSIGTPREEVSNKKRTSDRRLTPYFPESVQNKLVKEFNVRQKSGDILSELEEDVKHYENEDDLEKYWSLGFIQKIESITGNPAHEDTIPGETCSAEGQSDSKQDLSEYPTDTEMVTLFQNRPPSPSENALMGLLGQNQLAPGILELYNSIQSDIMKLLLTTNTLLLNSQMLSPLRQLYTIPQVLSKTPTPHLQSPPPNPQLHDSQQSSTLSIEQQPSNSDLTQQIETDPKADIEQVHERLEVDIKDIEKEKETDHERLEVEKEPDHERLEVDIKDIEKEKETDHERLEVDIKDIEKEKETDHERLEVDIKDIEKEKETDHERLEVDIKDIEKEKETDHERLEVDIKDIEKEKETDHKRLEVDIKDIEKEKETDVEQHPENNLKDELPSSTGMFPELDPATQVCLTRSTSSIKNITKPVSPKVSDAVVDLPTIPRSSFNSKLSLQKTPSTSQMKTPSLPTLSTENSKSVIAVQSSTIPHNAQSRNVSVKKSDSMMQNDEPEIVLKSPKDFEQSMYQLKESYEDGTKSSKQGVAKDLKSKGSNSQVKISTDDTSSPQSSETKSYDSKRSRQNSKEVSRESAQPVVSESTNKDISSKPNMPTTPNYAKPLNRNTEVTSESTPKNKKSIINKERRQSEDSQSVFERLSTITRKKSILAEGKSSISSAPKGQASTHSVPVVISTTTTSSLAKGQTKSQNKLQNKISITVANNIKRTSITKSQDKMQTSTQSEIHSISSIHSQSRTSTAPRKSFTPEKRISSVEKVITTTAKDIHQSGTSRSKQMFCPKEFPTDNDGNRQVIHSKSSKIRKGSISQSNTSTNPSKIKTTSNDQQQSKTKRSSVSISNEDSVSIEKVRKKKSVNIVEKSHSIIAKDNSSNNITSVSSVKSVTTSKKKKKSKSKVNASKSHKKHTKSSSKVDVVEPSLRKDETNLQNEEVMETTEESLLESKKGNSNDLILTEIDDEQLDITKEESDLADKVPAMKPEDYLIIEDSSCGDMSGKEEINDDKKAQMDNETGVNRESMELPSDSNVFEEQENIPAAISSIETTISKRELPDIPENECIDTAIEEEGFPLSIEKLNQPQKSSFAEIPSKEQTSTGSNIAKVSLTFNDSDIGEMKIAGKRFPPVLSHHSSITTAAVSTTKINATTSVETANRNSLSFIQPTVSSLKIVPSPPSFHKQSNMALSRSAKSIMSNRSLRSMNKSRSVGSPRIRSTEARYKNNSTSSFRESMPSVIDINYGQPTKVPSINDVISRRSSSKTSSKVWIPSDSVVKKSSITGENLHSPSAVLVKSPSEQISNSSFKSGQIFVTPAASINFNLGGSSTTKITGTQNTPSSPANETQTQEKL